MSHSARSYPRTVATGAVLLLAIGHPSPAGLDETQFFDSWRWASFTTASGLPSNEIISLVETPGGTTWASTRRGIAWFDGYHWIAMGPADGIPALGATGLATVAEEDILVCMRQMLFRGNAAGFRRLPDTHAGQKVDLYSAVPLDSRRILVLGRGIGEVYCGLYCLEGDRFQPFETPGRISPSWQPAIWRTRGGQIWVSTHDGLFTWNGTGWQCKRNAETSWFRVRVLAENRRGEGLAQTVFPSETAGLWRWEAGGGMVVDDAARLDPAHAMDINEAGDAVAVCKSGSVRVRRGGEWFTTLPTPPRMRGVTCIHFANDGELWVGTTSGLNLLRTSASRWSHWRRGTPDRTEMVNALLRASDGSFWIGTGAGVERRRPDGRVESHDRLLGIPLGPVTGLGEDPSGHVWISSGSGFRGSLRWDGREWRYFGQADGLADEYFHRITAGRQGRLWFLGIAAKPLDASEPGPGAFAYEGKSFTPWGVAEGLPSGRVYAVLDEPDGTLWFGTWSGLSRHRNGQWKHWGTADGLRYPKVFALARTPTGRVWVGQQVGWLGYVDSQDRLQSVEDETDAAAAGVQDLQVDAGGKLWIATRGGLFTWLDGTWCDLTAHTGLENTDLWPVLPLKDRVYVGTEGSGTAVLTIEPVDRQPPKVVMETPLVEHRAAWLRWSAHSYRGALPGESIETRYRVDNGPWSPWGRSRELRLQSVSAGDHEVTVQAKGMYGDFDPAGCRATFSVALPRYLQPGVVAPVAGLSLALVGLWAVMERRKRRHQLAVEASEQQLQAIMDNTPAVIYVKDTQGKYLSINRRFEELFDISKQEIMGRTDLDVFPPEMAGAFRANDRRVLAERQAILVEEVAPHDDGPHTYISAKFPLYSPDGQPAAVCGISTDITPRLKAEQGLAERVRHADLVATVGIAFTRGGDLRAILQRCAEALVVHLDVALARIWTYDGAGSDLELQASAGLYTHIDGSHRRIPMGQFKIGRIAQSRHAHLSNTVQDDPQIHDPEWARREGLVSFAGHPLVLADRLVGVVAVFSRRALTQATMDLLGAVADHICVGIDHHRAEAALRGQALVFENIYDGVILTDTERRITGWNRGAERIFGYPAEEVIGRSPEMLNRPDEARAISQRIQESLRREGRWSGEVPFVHKDGREGLCEAIVVPLLDAQLVVRGLVSVNRDVTERRRTEAEKARLEERLRQSQKLESIGTLASGVAHDFNNLLQAIFGYTDQAKTTLDPSNPAAASIDMVELAASQARGVVNSLLTFAHMAPTEKKPVNLTQVVAATLRLLQRLMPAGIRMTGPPDDCPDIWIQADATQIQQVLMNLAVNSRDAMPEGGRLEVTLGVEAMTRPSTARAEGSGADDDGHGMPKRLAVLVVTDTGTGMTEEVRSRLFDPYFTTKPRGQGTGLGLPICRSIVVDHKGTIEVATAPRRGTRVTVTIPVFEAPPSAGPRRKAPARVGQGEVILVIEDHAQVRSVMSTILRSCGYDVLAATDPAEALAALQRKPEPVRLVIQDVDLPQAELMEELRRHPSLPAGLPTILVTGGLRPVAPDEQAANQFVLRKPFQVPDLADLVARCLGKTAGRPAAPPAGPN